MRKWLRNRCIPALDVRDNLLMTDLSESRHLTIGFLRRGYSPTGGVEAYLKGLAEGLLAEGHRVILIGTEDWPSEAWPGSEILRCSGKTLRSYVREVAFFRRGSAISFDLILSVEKVPGCDLYRTDEGIHAAWLAQRSRYLSPWARIFQWISPKHREKLRFEKELFTPDATRRVISLSEKISKEIVERYAYPPEKITLIRNGISRREVPTLREKMESRCKIGIGSDEKIVLFVGTGWERKGLRFAIRAVEKLQNPNIKLLVAGKGPQNRYGSPYVRFLGPVTDMSEVYSSSDIFLLPTIFDPFPLAGLEALRAGLPVITTTANGLSEVITSGVHGEVIAEPSDVIALSESLRKWLKITDDPEEGHRVRLHCASLAARFTLERNLAETMTLIREVIAEKSTNC